ncbi:MAG: hypothetical protein BGN92_05015 [Sphingobacteriales bacterium 41-5]|nr:MAG: hypothetical protein BGN92_05015 [Sphingobacteriales bacterium 41-5]
MAARFNVHFTDDFTGIIEQLIADKKHADFIMDINGWERAAGVIIKPDDNTNTEFIQLDNGRLINVNSIIAINGIFKNDCTCY